MTRRDMGDYARECIRRSIAAAEEDEAVPSPTPELIAELRVIIHGSAAEPLNVNAA
jgi:hypothetical protein